MKKLLSTLILALACLCSAWAQQDTIRVSTAKEFYQAVEKHGTDKNAVIKLMADIDAAEYHGDKHFDMEFKATIDGYYTYVDSLGEVDPNPHSRMIKHHNAEDGGSFINGAYLVSKLQNATIKGVTFFECNTSIWKSRIASVVCQEANDSEIRDVIFIGCQYNSSTWDLYSGSSGLLASVLHNCSVEGVIVMACSLNFDGNNVGLIAGEAWGTTFTECVADATSSIYCDAEPDAYVAGLVAYTNDCKFDQCYNYALVSASMMSDILGGITAMSTNTTFTDCFNGGTITQLSEQAYSNYMIQCHNNYNSGMLYSFGSSLSLRTARYFTARIHRYVKANIRYGDLPNDPYFKQQAKFAKQELHIAKMAKVLLVFAVIQTIYDVAKFIYDQNAPDEVGGITSTAYACTYERCINTGFLSCRDAYCGGIVGYADTKDGKITKINKCINEGYIMSGEQSGGIVGYLKDSHATNCLNIGTVDCVKETRGPIYGDTNAKGTTITTCFALEHGAKYQEGTEGGEGVIVKFGIEDLVSGRAAYEMNRIAGIDDFRQKVGEERYPSFTGDVVQASDIRTDLNTRYKVKNLQDFIFALSDQYADILLEGDVDFGGGYYSIYRGSCKFHGSIDGNGYVIKNVKIDIEDTENKNFDQKNERHAMIQFAEGATFKNLTLDNMTVKHGIMIAGLVGNSKNSTYENVNITNSTIYAENSWIGGLVYESDHDTFTRCETDMKTSVSTHGIPAGDLHAYAGGLVSKAKGSTFTDCTNWADVSGKCDVVGGIVSYDEGSTFTRCRNYGSISHDSWAIKDDDELGGIVAEAKNSKFYECINAGVLSCEDENGGGIVGLGTNVTIINCVNAEQNLKFSENTCGGIIGYAENSMIANCVSLADLPCIGESTGTNLASGNNYRVKIGNDRSNRWEAAVDEKTMKSGLVCRWLNNGYENRKEGRTVWYQVLSGMFQDMVPFPDGSRHPEVLTTDLPHDVITSADQLVAFAKKVNGGDNYACAVLDADIDLSTVGDWTPIGNHKNRFQGVFDGQGHTIHGMKVNINSNDVGAGLFGVTHMNAEIRNVIIADDCEVNNSGEAGAGGILGRFHIGWVWGNMVIENCGSYAKVSAKKHAGGIMGRLSVDSGTDYGKNVKVYVNNCFNMGNIYASESNSGLLIGYAQNSGRVTNCWSAGSLNKMKESNPAPYSSQNPKNETEYFAGYDQKISIVNCYAMEPLPAGQNVRQDGVQTLEAIALTDGHLTYRLNRNKTTGYLDWYQKIGVDARPMLTSRGGDIVYLYLSDDHLIYYVNDDMRDSFDFFGAVRVKKDKTLALLEANSQNPITLNSEIEVGRAELNRSFTANVPSTLVLPFSGEIDSESSAKFFSFSAMYYDKTTNKYTAVMDQVEGGKFEAYTPYLALFAEDTADSLVFENVTLKPVTPAVTQQDEWYFIGATAYKAISLQDEESQYYYGYAGREFNGFHLGEFARLGEGAYIAPFRCYMRHIASEDAPDSFDVITKAPTRSAVPDNQLSVVTEEISMPKAFDVILKGANGETGIATFDNETGEFHFEGWYDLNGNRVDENYQGVRVGNGKKVMIKEY